MIEQERHDPYRARLLETVARREDCPPPIRRLAAAAARVAAPGAHTDGTELLLRLAERLAEWGGQESLLPEPPINPDRSGPLAPRLPVVLYVPSLRSPFNLGNMIRSAATFGIAGVVVDDAAPDLNHPRVRRAAMGGDQLLPVERGGLDDARRLAAQRVGRAATDGSAGSLRTTVVLETAGTAIHRFVFPAGGVLVVGHEERGVPQDILGPAEREGRVVTIPHHGPKASLNVGVAMGIGLSWWETAGDRAAQEHDPALDDDRAGR